MRSDFQIRLYEMEVSPPQQVWEKLSASLDEINADNRIASKVYDSESIPLSDSWEKIKGALLFEEFIAPEKKGIVINFKRFAIAAISIGIIFSLWLLFFNSPKKNSDLAETKILPVTEEKSIEQKADPVLKSTDTNSINTGINSTEIASNKIHKKNPVNNNQNDLARNKNVIAQTIKADKPVTVLQNEKPGDKAFDQPIDDLSMIAANENYMTMVNTNGRMIKIPKHLAYLAPRLQDKPLTEDYHEIMFGEGAFWNDKLSEWRQKLATLPVSSGDIFSTMVDLLKNVQGK